MSGATVGVRAHARGLPWGVTWRLFLFVPAKLMDCETPGLRCLIDDTSVGGPAVVDDYGTLVLVGPMQ